MDALFESGERFEYECPALVSDHYETLREGENISAAVSNQAVYLLSNARRPREAKRLAFDEIQLIYRTTDKTILIETYDGDDYIIAPQSATLTKSTTGLANALAAWAPDRIVDRYHLDLLPDGRGMTLFQLSPRNGAEGFDWSLVPDSTLSAAEAQPYQTAVKRRAEIIVERATRSKSD
ncbi:hypothetical protein OHR86_17000 [Streptomyces sp. NBC_00441]|uniref:hypothetical protein n=1 Tax=Streptomyces sp. NBC_00441 TaxID=2975742 RepID=UPI002E2AE628|nr:hypothetical protein [Streptomyces sp. NBC_00441]